MLLYNPAFDIHHGMFRMLLLMFRMYPQNIELDKVLILDFYLLFPQKLLEVKLTQDARREANNLLSFKENPYNKVSDSKILFQQMRNYQLAAISCLASYGIIDKELLDSGYISLNLDLLTQDVKTVIEEYYKGNSKVVDLLTDYVAKIELKKDKGLKYRTGLLEYRYDV